MANHSDPEEPIRVLELGRLRLAAEHSELVTESQIFEREIAA